MTHTTTHTPDLTAEDMRAMVAWSFVRQAGKIGGLDEAQLTRGKELMSQWSLTYGEKFPYGCEPLPSEWPAGATHRLIVDAGHIAASAQRKAVYFTPKQ